MLVNTNFTNAGKCLLITFLKLYCFNNLLFQAEACKNLDEVFKKCPNGVYSEIKYDGERVQLHKNEKEFKFYSRSLKPVLAHKVNTDYENGHS